MTKLYGIKNCDTVKKACRWLEANNIDYHFHDLRNDGIERPHVENWLTQLGWEKVLNKRSTTWKKPGQQHTRQHIEWHRQQRIGYQCPVAAPNTDQAPGNGIQQSATGRL